MVKVGNTFFFEDDLVTLLITKKCKVHHRIAGGDLAWAEMEIVGDTARVTVNWWGVQHVKVTDIIAALPQHCILRVNSCTIGTENCHVL
jgi:hypothetical protein